MPGARNRRGPVERVEVNGTADADKEKEEKMEFRKFVREMRFSKGRTVEMRLAILASIVIGLRVFMSDLVSASDVAYNIFLFLLLLVLVVVLSTWLDYFPNKLKSLKLRPSDGQGLPLGCLLSPMVCLGIMVYASDHQSELIDSLSVYLTASCLISLLTLASTFIYFISFPNSIAIYNFTVIGSIGAMQFALGTPQLPLAIAAVSYSLLLCFLLYNFSESFTVCEAMLVSQALALLFTNSLTHLCTLLELSDPDPSFPYLASEPVIFLEVGVAAIVGCCILLSPLLYMLASTDDPFYIHLWSVLFLQATAAIVAIVMLPWLQELLGQRPIYWLMDFITLNPTRVYLLLYCVLVTGVALFIVWAQSSSTRCLSCFRSESPSSLWMRKWFHLLALAVYAPSIALDPSFISLAAALATIVFLALEIVRVFRVWPFGETVHQLLIPFVDSRDAGDLILTHTYLLLGFSLPLWLFPGGAAVSGVAKFGLYSGVLSLGVGDSIAAVSGTLIGRNKWPGTSKTIEGSVMSFICQMIVAAVIMMTDPAIPMLSAQHWLVLAFSVGSSVALEAYTKQVDNLLLGVYQFALLVTFLH